MEPATPIQVVMLGPNNTGKRIYWKAIKEGKSQGRDTPPDLSIGVEWYLFVLNDITLRIWVTRGSEVTPTPPVHRSLVAHSPVCLLCFSFDQASSLNLLRTRFLPDIIKYTTQSKMQHELVLVGLYHGGNSQQQQLAEEEKLRPQIVACLAAFPQISEYVTVNTVSGDNARASLTACVNRAATAINRTCTASNENEAMESGNNPCILL